MQIDLHYYGTYCLARAAGIKREPAQIIAYASQFVDDNVAMDIEDHDDGSKIIAVPTAHHVLDFQNRDHEDQRYIWVPFHFIPGGKGDAWTEKLICRKDSQIAREMVRHHRQQYLRPYTLELMGITAHVYADTFAHYGFSGVSSRRNRVIGDSLVLQQSDDVVEAALGKTFSEWIEQYGDILSNIRSKISDIAEIYSGSLGHGAVSNYPDLPFLQWSFIYEHTNELIERDNQATYLEGAEKLHEMFTLYAKENESAGGDIHTKWSTIKDYVGFIFEQYGDKWERAELWKVAAADGKFGIPEDIPEYTADKWNNQAESFSELEESSEAKELDIYKFYCAANYHLHYVLRELLPSKNIIVI